MFIDRLNKKFKEFYSEKDVIKAREISKEILDMLDEKGLQPYDFINGKEGVYLKSFNDYFKVFEFNPNPYKSSIETMRIIVMNTLKYEP